MPIIPTAPFAQTPNLAGAAAQGSNVALKRQQLAQQAQQAQMQAQLQAQQIAAQSRIAAQRLAQAQYQSEIENQMAQSRFGLAERELSMQEAEMARKAQEAARSLQFSEEYRNRVAAGEDPTSVAQEMLPLLDLPAGAYSAIGRGQEPGLQTVPQIVNDPETGQRIGTAFQTGPRSQQFIPGTGEAAGGPPEVMGVPGLEEHDVVRFGGGREQLVRRPDPARFLKEELDALVKLHTEDTGGRLATARPEEDLGKTDKSLREAFLEREKQINDLMGEIRKARAPKSPAAPGSRKIGGYTVFEE